MTSDPRVHAGEGGGLGEGGATAHLQKVVFVSCIKVFFEVHILATTYLATTYIILGKIKIANFTHHLSQEYDDVGWL